MFERFTDRARRVVVLAQEEARMLNHNYIGTEHILLGLLHEGEGVAASALQSLGISLEEVRSQVEEIIGQGQSEPTGHIPFTPRAKKVLELSLREALQLGHNYIGTEHILLGLIREGEGVGAQVLQKVGADLNRVRQQVIGLLAGYAGPGEGESAPAPPVEPEDFTARVARAEEIEAVAAEVAAEFGHESAEPGHHWVAALRLNLRQMEEAIEAYRAKLRWAEQRLKERSNETERPEAPPEEHRGEGSGDQPAGN
jgi:ATP-dependent Clp protease ATP-binding subunit ClpA